MLRHKLKQRLFEAIRDAYPNMYSLERVHLLCEELGYRASNGERRLRELCESGVIRKIESEKHYVMGYIFVPPPTAVFTEKHEQERLFKLRPLFA